ncbi:MAG TPA: alcohol dehydrogenase catalytic domain-containing protein [Phycisphaerae bacterium]|nr:alcohol dehydrogenase catalytic domain-containing protein [Phycisphaerae bacterium]
MQAVVVRNGAATVESIADPQPGDGEVLIKVRLAGICSTDLEIIRGYASFEGVIGHEFVGTVVSPASKLMGKRVVGEINCVCGRCDMCQSGLSTHCRRRTVLGIQGRSGCFAEFVCLPEKNCLAVSENVSDEEAVFAEPLAAAFQVLRQAKLEKRTQVAVVGTGRLGLLVAQVLATTPCRLIAVGRNPKTLSLLDRRGIQAVTLDQLQRRQDFDIVVDCTGSSDGLGIAMELVRPRGTIVMKTTCKADHAVDLTLLVVNEITLVGNRCGAMGEALNALARKQIDVTSLITRKLPLSEGVQAIKLAGEPDQIKVLLAGLG